MCTDEFLQLAIGNMENFLQLNINKGNPDIKFEATLKWLCVSPDRLQKSFRKITQPNQYTKVH